MRFSNIALAASAVGAASAATSLCDKYTMALLGANSATDQLTVLTLLVNTAVIGNYTGPGSANPTLPGTKTKLPGSMNMVPGILAKGKVGSESVNLLQYFDGSLASTNNNGKAAVVSFLDGGGATPILKDVISAGKKGSNQYTLLTHLYSYFGVLLGCSKVGKGSFPAYAGDTSMASVHQYMALDLAEVTYFVEQVGLAATSFGVTTSDAKAVGTTLLATFGERCAAPVAIPSTASKELQAICIESDCPKAKNPDCGAYPKVVEPMKASSGSSSGGSSGGTNAASSLTPAVGGVLAAAGIAAALL